VDYDGGQPMKQIIWNDEAGGNVEHIEEHGLTVADIEHVLDHYSSRSLSASSGLPCVFGLTPDGIYIVVIFEEVDGDTVYPVTAYEVPEP
jgi:hypothetical protein